MSECDVIEKHIQIESQPANLCSQKIKEAKKIRGVDSAYSNRIYLQLLFPSMNDAAKLALGARLSQTGGRFFRGHPGPHGDGRGT